jgi:hypothetical protein
MTTDVLRTFCSTLGQSARLAALEDHRLPPSSPEERNFVLRVIALAVETLVEALENEGLLDEARSVRALPKVIDAATGEDLAIALHALRYAEPLCRRGDGAATIALFTEGAAFADTPRHAVRHAALALRAAGPAAVAKACALLDVLGTVPPER